MQLLELKIPDSNIKLKPGDRIKLGRFESTLWKVHHGWFSFGGNRPWCGWYLATDMNGEHIEKPVQLTDLDDIYIVKKQN